MSQPTLEAAEQRLEKLQQQKKALEAKISREQGRLREKERKARTRRLIEYGGLVALADLDAEDKGTVLGGLLQVAERMQADEAVKVQWKRRGEQVLAERAASSKARSSPKTPDGVAQNELGAAMQEAVAD